MQDNFRTQAFGFNKKDVIDYIFELNSQKENIEEELSAKVRELEAQNEALNKQNTELNENNERFSKQLSEVRAELADANLQKSRLFEENNENRRMLLENEREFNIKNEQINKLIAENEEYAEKCAKYAEISENVGKTIMEAKKMASDIVAKAEEEAQQIRKITSNTAESALRELSSAKNDIETLKANLMDTVRICENRIKTVELNLGSAEESVKEFKIEKQETEEENAYSIPSSKEFF